ncbi:RNases MRP/P 32.9 kDa subunit [Monosporozyma unispora]|nr:RNase P/RNase MRP complex subunit [Kazachstania unispora]
MERSQEFIKKCLFTKNFDNPNKPIDENRLRDTLIVIPTGGGISQRLKQNKSRLSLSAANLVATDSKIKHSSYRDVNKNSKIAMKNYIQSSRKVCQRAKRIAYEQKLKDKEGLYKFLKEKEQDIWEQLPRYENYLSMYEKLWLGYIREVLGIEKDVKDSKKLNMNQSSALTKLSMAEYNGAMLRVVKSINKDIIGKQGIVIWDSQKSFIMITKGKLVDELKVIPKRGTVFNFEVPINESDALQYTILGDRFKYRSSDRAARKFKGRRCDDLLYYLQQ